MNLPDELNRLPPQVLDVIRYLGSQEENGAWLDDMMAEMGMSERSVRKWLRRLVTRYYAEMPIDGFYMLTATGKQAGGALREFDAANPGAARVVSYAETLDDDDLAALAQAEPELSAAPSAAPDRVPPPASVAPASPSAAPPAGASPDQRHVRRMVVVVPRELVARETVTVKVGLERPAGQPPLSGTSRAIIRLSAPGCEVKPGERPLDITPEGLVGPLRYEVTPRQEGRVRVKIEVFQLMSLRELVPVGGMYFDLKVAPADSDSARQAQALAAEIRLRTQ